MRQIGFLLSAILIFSTNAFAGRESGGGNTKAAEFPTYARYALVAIKNDLAKGGKTFRGVEMSAIEEALDAMEVYVFKDLCSVNESRAPGADTKVCLDARFIAESHRIEFSASSWEEKGCLEKMTLTMHEYGRAAGIETATYSFSSRIATSATIRDYCAYLVDELNRLKRNGI